MKNIESREPSSIVEEETYWKSLWGESQHNEITEGIGREEKREISHMYWMPIQITEITSCLSNVHSWKSHGNNQIQN